MQTKNTELGNTNTQLALTRTELELNKTALAQKDTELAQKNTELIQKNIELEQKNTELTQKYIELEQKQREFYLQNATDSVDRLQQRIQSIGVVLDGRANEGLDVAERQRHLEGAAECHRGSIDGMERIRYEDYYNSGFAQTWNELGENIKCGHRNANEACPPTDSMCKGLSAPDLSPLPVIDLLLRGGENVFIIPVR